MRRATSLLLFSLFLPLVGLRATATAPQDQPIGVLELAPHFIPEDQITLEKLHVLFDEAFIENSVDVKNKELEVTDSGLTIELQVSPDEKVIQYITTWNFKTKSDVRKKLELVNTLNDKYIFVRYCSSKNATVLWCDYDLYYGGGVLDFNVVHTFREFVTLLNDNIGKFGWNNLVQ